jgi:hypothetical protein
MALPVWSKNSAEAESGAKPSFGSGQRRDLSSACGVL